MKKNGKYIKQKRQLQNNIVNYIYLHSNIYAVIHYLYPFTVIYSRKEKFPSILQKLSDFHANNLTSCEFRHTAVAKITTIKQNIKCLFTKSTIYVVKIVTILF